ncbi:MAG TPA: DNA internalization-related competence protein ComEC/Rec2 [Steroidobacteraceae bacterium]|nr:DNA internalization-related competence protein ComEC/Rec2 [Steroidobacteraceae bacterium]
MGRLAVAFLLGHCWIHCLPRLPAWHWSLALLAAALALVRVGKFKLGAAAAAGVAWALLNSVWRTAGDLPPTLEGQDLLVRGYVASLARAAGGDSQFMLDVVAPRGGVSPRIRLVWYQAARAPQAGELWQLVVRLKRRNGFANPGGTDHEAQLFREGVGATGYVREDARNAQLAPPSSRYAVTRLRAWISDRIQQSVHDRQMLGVLQGLAVGDTQAMSPEQWRVFAATGTTHLMAISGLHISMVAALAAWLGGAIVRLPRAQMRRWSAMHGQVIAGSAAALAYSTLAGLSVPTQRTLLMLAIYFAARWHRRELAVTHALGLSLTGVLLVDPFAPLAPGAWLSFGAVAIILLAVAGRVRRDGEVTAFVRVQGAITIGLAPLLLAAFGSVSLLSPLANAIAVPLFTVLIVPTVLLGAGAACVSLSAGEWVLAIPVHLMQWAWPLLQSLAERPLALWHFPQPSLPAFMALVVGALLIVAPGIWPTRLAGVLLCMPVLLQRVPGPTVGDFELAMLDVGQGLAVVVRTHSHVLLYDAGPAFPTGRDAAELAVLPYLRHRGVRALDALVVSHGDLDHRGGVESVLAALPVARIITGPSVEPLSRTAVACRRAESWTWDGVQFEVLHPASSARVSDNDSSCVLLVRSAAGSVLLAGDVEQVAESEIVGRGLKPATAVIVPHHGSRTSSTAPFVAAARPTIALVSAGYRNRWGLPRSDVVDRWHAGGAHVLTTAQSGAIEIAFVAGRPPLVREFRRTHRRYWHR